MRLAILVCALSTATAYAGTSLRAQQTVFGKRDLELVAGAVAGDAALMTVDGRIARAFADSGLHLRHPAFTTAADRTSRVTETVLMIAGGSIWGIARVAHDRGTADVALHSTEAVFSTAMVIQVVRGALGRGRPYVLDDAGHIRDQDPHEFELLHGFTSFNYRSWPSMHAMASFAVASALAEEMRVRDTPHRAEIAPVLYTAAAAPALARLYLDEHWTSDIAMGVFLGIYAGQKVVLYSHSHPGNPVDRRLLGPAVHATISHGAQGFSFYVVPF